ncbi:MAG: glycosyltransferase family 87 protein, partial [Candidatus Woesebacteria bacterium]
MTPNKSKVSIPAFSGQITKILIVSLIVGIVFSIWINTVFDSKHDEIAQKDYTSYLTGAYMVRKGAGQLLYDVSAQISYQTRLRALPDDIKSQPLPFKTPPFVSLIFLPFTGLPLVAGYKLFSLLNMTILVFIVWLINAKTIKKRGSVYLYLLAYLFFPSISLLIRGQVSLYLFLVIIGVYFSLRENLSLKAGAISGLILIKPQYLLLIPPFF